MRVEKPCSSQGIGLKFWARRIVSLVLFGARVGTDPCYPMWSGHSCPLLLTLPLIFLDRQTENGRSQVKIEVKGSGQECPLHIVLHTGFARGASSPL